ncbi:MAG: hypothetical protein ACRCT2_10130, partial [Plesiomonas shigelloides]
PSHLPDISPSCLVSAGYTLSVDVYSAIFPHVFYQSAGKRIGIRRRKPYHTRHALLVRFIGVF